MKAIIIIPGNPPASHFYEGWKQEIERITHQNVIVDYYPSFSDITCSATYLQKIEDFYASTIRHHENITLIGHSFGGYIALKLLAQYSANIEQCALLFPFLHSPGIRAKCTLAALHHINSKPWLKKPLIKSLNLLHPNMAKLTPNEIGSGLTLACHEHNTIGREKNIHINPQLHPKITLYYTHNDTWCSKKMLRRLPPQLRTERIDVTHDFVTHQTQRTIVNKRLFNKTSIK
ncbi:MAG: hypothetical protein P1U32_08050 [Legionellaceae bacterium]|nr:hypothetical protein [Legionellaceae bacterium]